MNIDKFLSNSNKHLAKLISTMSFDFADESTLGIVVEPYKLGNVEYDVRYLKGLTYYLPDPEIKDEMVKYTFFILKALGGVKEKFLEECNKKNSGQRYDENVIGDYYMNFVPGFKPFDEFSHGLTAMIEEDILPGKGYKFTFNLATVTKDFDFALVYLETNSVMKLAEKYPGDKEIDFKILDQ